MSPFTANDVAYIRSLKCDVSTPRSAANNARLERIASFIEGYQVECPSKNTRVMALFEVMKPVRKPDADMTEWLLGEVQQIIAADPLTAVSQQMREALEKQLRACRTEYDLTAEVTAAIHAYDAIIG